MGVHYTIYNNHKYLFNSITAQLSVVFMLRHLIQMGWNTYDSHKMINKVL